VIRTTSKASILKPPRLQPGDQIGVISPAGPVTRSDLQAGLKTLESSGLRVLVAPHVYEKRGYLAGEDEARLTDLHAMFQDPDIAAIICARGGYGTLRLLDKIRYDLIEKNPKILVGYSDITALLIAIHAKTGLVTFHGPMVRELTRPKQRNWDSLFRLISSSQPIKIGLTGGSAFKTGKVAGPLIGGNLSLLCHLVGTPFLPSLDGCILFMEEKGEPLYRLDRMMTHLVLSGQLRRLSGLVVGEFEGCGDQSSITQLVGEILLALEIPLATGLPAGHGLKNLTLPIGLMAELDTNLMTLSVMEACVK
jgi:muramoyltetrapeptide carboxypeptidase